MSNIFSSARRSGTGGTTSSDINPYGIRSNEFVSSLHKLVRNIKEYSVTTLEKLGITTLTKGAAQVRPYAIVSAQNIGQAKLTGSIKSYSIRSNEVLGRNSLVQNVKPYSIRSLEQIGFSKIVSNIKPYSISSNEKLGQNSLLTSASIKPYAVVGGIGSVFSQRKVLVFKTQVPGSVGFGA